MGSARLYLDEPRVRLWLGDCREVLATLPECSVDVVITDPPYEVGIGGAGWDRTGVSFQPSTWAAVLRVLKPGAVLVAFALPRLYHRLACAVEDAGFEVLDMTAWWYATGKPPAPTRLKPAHEPAVVAMRPMSERTVEANRARWGTGALWPDNARIGSPESKGWARTERTGRTWLHGQSASGEIHPGKHYGNGRWPANLVLSHADTCSAAGCVDGCPVAELNTQGGVRRSGAMKAGTVRTSTKRTAYDVFRGAATTKDIHGDVGSASRFYFVTKPRGASRVGHITEKPPPLLEHIARWACPPRADAVWLDPFAGSGSSLEAAEQLGCVAWGVELEEEHCALSLARLREHAPQRALPIFGADHG